MPPSDPAAVARALEGRPHPVFADLSRWWKFEVAGSDAGRWLNDLVTNRVDDLAGNQTRRTLFLDRTGRIKADFHVFGLRDGSLLLVQDPVQPRPILDLLNPYVLSSDVALTGRTDDLGLVATPTVVGHVLTVECWRPSVLGGGSDTIVPATQHQTVRARHRSWLEASEHDLEVWRIRRGVPRFGVDFGDDWLPSEAGLDDLVDTTKGCFLGQESVAKVRNLGHPPRVIQSLVASDPVSPMAVLMTEDGAPVGRITSVAPNDDGSTACIGWVRWEARDARLETEGGGFRLVRRSSD